jgi:hypothetical protein
LVIRGVDIRGGKMIERGDWIRESWIQGQRREGTRILGEVEVAHLIALIATEMVTSRLIALIPLSATVAKKMGIGPWLVLLRKT